jgi:hypothetical protein
MKNSPAHQRSIARAGSAIALLALMLPPLALAKNCDPPSRRVAHSKKEPGAKTHTITIQREPPIKKDEATEIDLDANTGRALRHLLSDDLGADVEWRNERLGERVIKGSFRGSRDVIAQKLLENFNFAIFHDHSRLRVIVLSLEKGAVTTKAISPIPNQPPNQTPKP